MDALYRAGRATANEVVAVLPRLPHLSTVRTQLRILEEKGFIAHEVDGPRYVYAPTVPRACGAPVRSAAPGGHLLRRAPA